MNTTQPPPALDTRPWWRTSPGAAAIAFTSVAAVVTAGLIINYASQPEPGDAYVAEVRAAAPANITIDEPTVLATATKACEAGDYGTVGLSAALAQSGFAPTAIVHKIMPAHDRYCRSLD